MRRRNNTIKPKNMKTKRLKIVFGIFALSVLMLSCHKEPQPDDKNKIDIKGSLMGGDMKNPHLEVTFFEKTLCVRFYDNLGDCTINISNRANAVVICDTVNTFYNTSYWYYFYDQPLDRYHLVISNGSDEAEGWFNNFRIVAHKQ